MIESKIKILFILPVLDIKSIWVRNSYVSCCLVRMMSLYIPEEDRSLDILELIEHPDLLRFHDHTLDLYQAVCCHGNHRAAHALTKHVDEGQLMFCIKSKCKNSRQSTISY